MMKPKKLLLIAAGAFLGLVLISNAIMSSYANAPGERLKAPVAQQGTAVPSEDQEPASLQSIVSSARIVFNKTFPDQNEVEWRPEERTVVIDVWPNGFGAEMAEYAMRDIKYLNDWNGICGSMSEISGDLREQFVKNGYDDVSVVVNMYDPDDIGLLLASARNGDLLYDVVASTPTGERIGRAG